jgi:vacuolar protein sorting-associated protein 35
MAIFDELRYLSIYISELLSSGSHKLADLYELVQYATQIVPRLYLMITVGSIYMKASSEYYNGENKVVDNDSGSNGDSKFATTKEILKDMLDMSGGVQHPTRGLFLRYYLSALTKDFLPDSPNGYRHFNQVNAEM